MRRLIVNFDQDDESHWRALLDCGHRQHVRHQPPLVRREWVLTEAGRAGMIGQSLDCVRCDDEAASREGPRSASRADVNAAASDQM